ncbi:MAG TPA: heme-binding protein [Kofleriaceae bacterium]|nr:heme-binding protein [Kofleriaceae bacterium]
MAAHGSFDRRTPALPVSLLAPAAANALSSGPTTRRRGILAAGMAALRLGTLRVQLARWLSFEPAFVLQGKAGDVELRRYDALIEACARVDDVTLEEAIDHGYGRLAGYICGDNQTGELLARTTPILTAMRDGCYTISFVMPSGRTLDGLPRPDHPGIELRMVPPRGIAALRFHGRCTRDNIAAHERVLLCELFHAGFSARGSISLASFDAPATLPILHRNELWIEVI